jgi:hypothetical protein
MMRLKPYTAPNSKLLVWFGFNDSCQVFIYCSSSKTREDNSLCSHARFIRTCEAYKTNRETVDWCPHTRLAWSPLPEDRIAPPVQ